MPKLAQFGGKTSRVATLAPSGVQGQGVFMV